MRIDAQGYADPAEFEAVAEATRKKVQRMVVDVAEIFHPSDSKPPQEAAALFWAQLSGVVTAAANGLAGLQRLSTDPDKGETLKVALHKQLDSAYAEAVARHAETSHAD